MMELKVQICRPAYKMLPVKNIRIVLLDIFLSISSASVPLLFLIDNFAIGNDGIKGSDLQTGIQNVTGKKYPNCVVGYFFKHLQCFGAAIIFNRQFCNRE